jgi:hypothetical protein
MRRRSLILRAHASATPKRRSIRPFGSIMRFRDTVRYDPYQAYAHDDAYSARVALERGRGFCIAKAALLAACARAVAIPARLGFADVRNHLATARLIEMNGSDVFRWHGYTDLWLDGKLRQGDAGVQSIDVPTFRCDPAGIRRPHRFDTTSLRSQGSASYGVSRGPRHLCGRAGRKNHCDISRQLPSSSRGR